MDTCDHCRELIWDDLFGLLEAGESETLRRHVAACSACQAERAAAVAQHRLVAGAARLDMEIPPFTAPAADHSQPVLRPARPETAAVERRVRILPWLATAAAVLVLIGLPFGIYQGGRLRYEAALRAAEDGVAQVVKRREELRLQARSDHEDLVRVARAKHLRLQVVGPAAYQPGAVNPYRVWVTDVDGRPLDAPVTARLLDVGKPPLTLQTKKAAGKGELLVELPADLPLTPEHTPRLEVVARNQEEGTPVGTSLRVLEPAYVTHLATDKPVYHSGDTIYFRSLTLERFGHKAPDREFTAIYVLADARGEDFQSLRGLTRKDGTGGGEFEFSPNWPAGEYTLTITEAEKRFPPVTRRFLVRPKDRGQRETVMRTIPVASDPLEVEFFPEGGDLVAGLDNRVYFRVRTPPGQPADLHGAVADGHGREVVPVHTARPDGQPPRNRGLGLFTLRPQAGETYQLRVTSPQGLTVRAALPPVQASGVALSLPAVSGQDEPIRALLQQSGPGRTLVVGAFCQGRLVAQDIVPARPGRAEVRLAPAAPCSGVVRVTVFEQRQGQLWPVAERLAYRRPQKRLVLSVKADKESYAAGEKVKLNIRSLNEKGKPEAAWVSVSVVDQAALALGTTPATESLTAYFHLTSELQRPEDLEQADILLGGAPEGAAALDLFLGTQGWRRFAEPEAEKAPGTGNADAPRRAQDLAAPAILKLDNGEQVAQKYLAAVTPALADLQESVTRRERELDAEGSERILAARTAARELNDFEARAGELIRLGVGVGTVVLFGVGCLLLAVGLLRLVRGLTAPTAYLAGAFAALLLCALVAWGPIKHRGTVGNPIDPSRIDRLAKALQEPLDRPEVARSNNEWVTPGMARSKGGGTLGEKSSSRHSAGLAHNEETNSANARGIPALVSPRRPPLIGSVRAGPAEGPAPSHPNKNAPASPLVLREYAYPASGDAASAHKLRDTILWHPLLFAADGTAEVTFAVPPKAASYRIRVEGHSAAGRLGTVQEKLECRQGAPGTAR